MTTYPGQRNPAYRHGHIKNKKQSPTYGSWVAMKARVTNPNRYKNRSGREYHGRIDMDPRWKDFTAFLADMGVRPDGKTLERKDNAKGYWPKNCEWATPSEQRRNTIHGVYVSLDGKRMLVIEALEILNQNWGRYRYARWGKVRRNPQDAIDWLKFKAEEAA